MSFDQSAAVVFGLRGTRHRLTLEVGDQQEKDRYYRRGSVFRWTRCFGGDGISDRPGDSALYWPSQPTLIGESIGSAAAEPWRPAG